MRGLRYGIIAGPFDRRTDADESDEGAGGTRPMIKRIHEYAIFVFQFQPSRIRPMRKISLEPPVRAAQRPPGDYDVPYGP
jgi:hypothetical protein